LLFFCVITFPTPQCTPPPTSACIESAFLGKNKILTNEYPVNSPCRNSRFLVIFLFSLFFTGSLFLSAQLFISGIRVCWLRHIYGFFLRFNGSNCPFFLVPNPKFSGASRPQVLAFFSVTRLLIHPFSYSFLLFVCFLQYSLLPGFCFRSCVGFEG